MVEGNYRSVAPINAPAVASKPAEKDKAEAPLLLLLKTEGEDTSEVVAALSEVPEEEPPATLAAPVLFLPKRYYVRGERQPQGMSDYVPSGSSIGTSSSGGGASGWAGCRGGTSSDIELAGLGIDGGKFGGALHQVNAVASTSSGPTAAGRGDAGRACSDCVYEGCKDNIIGQKLAILVLCYYEAD